MFIVRLARNPCCRHQHYSFFFFFKADFSNVALCGTVLTVLKPLKFYMKINKELKLTQAGWSSEKILFWFVFIYSKSNTIGIQIQPWYFRGNKGHCFHAPWLLPWCPWNAPVKIYNFLLGCPLPRRKCLGTLALFKIKAYMPASSPLV